jgi:uncharacterized YigZ family protein
MQYVKEHYNTTLEVKQSKFIAHLLPYTHYEHFLEQLKTQHPKARHFVTAYRYLNEYEQIVEHASDDGEPKGTSGKPSLMVLQGKELINTAVIIVRYFGGTKLGTGGLVRAYSDAVNLVCESAEFFEYKKELRVTLKVAYSDVRFIDYECEVFKINIVEKAFQSKVIYTIKADKESMKIFLEKVQRVIKTL